MRREEERTKPRSGEDQSSSCAFLAGASPASVIAGEPRSRSQVRGRDPGARAGCQKPVKRRKLFSGEHVRGPQHEVKPAASTHLQSGSRAAHVTAKATRDTRAPEHVFLPGGVGGATRVQGRVRNTRDPSAWPRSGQVASYKPKAKSTDAQRKSEGLIVPLIVTLQNVTGGKAPCFGHARSEGKREGMAAKSGPNNPDARTCAVQVQRPQRELWTVAERRRLSRQRTNQRARSDTRARGRGRDEHADVHALSRRPSVSRVREIRMHGLKGGLALLPMNNRSSR